SDLGIAVRTVLEADRARQAGSQFSVHLTFSRAGADRPPRHEVSNVLRRDHVEKLASGGQTKLINLNEKLTRGAQAFIDIEAAVQGRVIDQTFPTDSSAWLFEVHAHDDFQLTSVFFPLFHKATGIFEGCFGIVDGARPDDYHHAVVSPIQNIVNRTTCPVDHRGNVRGAGEFAHDVRGRGQFLDFTDS